MRGVGDEPAALLLGVLQPLRQVVEFTGQQRQLVVAAHVDLLVIVALLDGVHGVHNGPHPAGEVAGVDQGKENHRQLQNDRDPENGLQQQIDDGTLGGVVFRDVDAAGHGAEVYNGRGSPGDHGPAVVAPGEHVVALAGPQNFRQKGILPQGFSGAVVDAQACAVRHQQPGGPEAFQLIQNAGNRGGVPYVQGGQLVRGQLAFFNHGAFLVFVEQSLAETGTEKIEKEQYRRRNGNVSQGVVKLGGTVPPQPGHFTFGNSSPLPTWSEYAGVRQDFPPASPAADGYGRPPSEYRCDIHRPRWCRAALPGNRPGWHCA